MRASLYLNFTEHLTFMMISVGIIMGIGLSNLMAQSTQSIETFIVIFIVIVTVDIVSTFRRSGWESHLQTFPISKKNFVKAPMIVAWSHCLILFLIAAPLVFLRDVPLFETFRAYLFYYCVSLANIAVLFYLNLRYRHQEKIRGISYVVAFVTSIIASILYTFIVIFLGFIPLYVVPILFHIPLWNSYKKCVKMYEQMDIA